MRKLKFPATFKELKLSTALSASEMELVKLGREPHHMDDKWVIYFQDPWLYFHRFLTGRCIYKIHIVCKGTDCEIDTVLVNGDSDQYKFDDENIEAELFHKVFYMFLKSEI